MQYIQLQPQLAASVPTPEVGNVNIFVDSTTNLLTFKDSEENYYQSDALTGGTYNENNGILTLSSENNSIELSGFTNGNIVSGEYSSGTLTLTNVIGDSISISGFSTSSGGGVIDVTYSELYSAITGSTLQAGSTYRLTDYKSVNFLNGWENANNANDITPIDINYNPRQVYTSEEEVLLLKAISSNEFEPNIYSEKYNNDRIEFLPYVNKLTLDADFRVGDTLPNGVEVTDYQLQWDGTNVYIQMIPNYPVLFGHYFYLYCEFQTNINNTINSVEIVSGLPTLSSVGSVSITSGTIPVDTNFIVNTTTNGNGEGLILNINNNLFDGLTVNIISAGIKYGIGDEILVKGSDLGGVDSVDDIILNVETLGEISGVFQNVSSVSNNGTGATFNVSVNFGPLSGGYNTIEVVNTGAGYSALDEITILGSQLGGVDGVDDLVLSVVDVYNDAFSYYQDGVYEPITPYINECQYPYTTDDVDNNYLKKMTKIQVSENGYKVILLDLTEEDYNNYVQDTLYVNHVYSVNDAYGWITRRYDSEKNINVPFDFRNRKYRRFQADFSPIDINLGTEYFLIGDNKNILGSQINTTGKFKDFKVFENNGEDVYNIIWDGIGGPDSYWYNGFQDNNVFLYRAYNAKLSYYSSENTIYNLSNSKIGENFNRNIIFSQLESSIINHNHQGNLYYYLYGTNIGNNYYNNYFYNINGDKYGNEYQNNHFRGQFSNNIFGNNISTNLIYNGRNNNIASSLSNLSTNQNYYFDNNTISNNIQLSSFDFSLATHVYAPHRKTIESNDLGVYVLSYIDGNTNQLTITTSINS